MSDPILSILLLPQHLTPVTSHLNLLTALQQVINESYGNTYTKISEIFDSPYIRLPDPTQFARVLGERGFTVILVRINSVNEDGTIHFGEIVATGSVTDFKDGNGEAYAKWSQGLHSNECTSKDSGRRGSEPGMAEASYELTAFGVTPKFQAAGLGTKVLQEVEWILSSGWYETSRESALVSSDLTCEGIKVGDSSASFAVEGVNLELLRQAEMTTPRGRPDDNGLSSEKSKLVLMGIKELGREEYYIRRGFRTIWSGTVPTGTWSCKKPCTAVYMEKSVK